MLVLIVLQGIGYVADLVLRLRYHPVFALFALFALIALISIAYSIEQQLNNKHQTSFEFFVKFSFLQPLISHIQVFAKGRVLFFALLVILIP